jgi:23S rRNA (cytidine1920-2'-O)/16S rRNA (cytidine1409-2'-O)-methyltransferase
MKNKPKYASRAGEKLEHALINFDISVENLICADFGSSIGGFVDCLLKFGANRVYSVETGYGVLDWNLRNDQRVTVLERTNAMHVSLPEKVDFLTIDTSWTKLEKIIPNALENLKDEGHIIALVKSHYEAEDKKMLNKGRLQGEFIPEVLELVKQKLLGVGVEVLKETESPIFGRKGKNKEFLFLAKRVEFQ